MSEAAMPYVIVVGVDYSPASDLALEQALELASDRANAQVHVINVVRQFGDQALIDARSTPGFAVVSMQEANAKLSTYAQEREQAFRDGPAKRDGRHLPRVFVHVRLEAPSHEIAQLAADLEADLVVVGTHGRHGLSRWLLGSVAEAVVRLAPCPVFVARPKSVAEAPAVPRIEPPCPRCVETRRATAGKEMWCEQHRAHHGQRHTYHQTALSGGETEMPLLFHN